MHCCCYSQGLCTQLIIKSSDLPFSQRGELNLCNFSCIIWDNLLTYQTQTMRDYSTSHHDASGFYIQPITCQICTHKQPLFEIAFAGLNGLLYLHHVHCWLGNFSWKSNRWSVHNNKQKQKNSLALIYQLEWGSYRVGDIHTRFKSMKVQLNKM